MCTGYRSDLDMLLVFNDNQVNYYQNLIGVLRCTVYLGRIDTHVEFDYISSHLAPPPKGKY